MWWKQKKIAIILLAVLLSGWTVVVRAETDTLKVLQLNIWHEGTQVEGGFQAIVDEIIHAEADVAFLSEVRNYEGVPFVPRLIEALRQKGVVYYGEYRPLDVGILSRYPILEQEDVRATDKGEGSGSLLRALLQVGNRKVAVYSAHLDYKNYACYLPRGYDGATWKKMDAPVTMPIRCCRPTGLLIGRNLSGFLCRRRKKTVSTLLRCFWAVTSMNPPIWTGRKTRVTCGTIVA